MAKLTIEMDHKDARVLINALDLYSRLSSGQIEELSSAFSSPLLYNKTLTDDQKDVFIKKLNDIKEICFPDLSLYSSYGIFSNKVPDDAKFAYDIIQVLRNKISWYESPQGGMTVSFDSPLKCSKRDLIKVKIGN